MEVFNEQIVDIGLNVLGYLVAGGLGVLIYSVFQRRPRPIEATAAAAVTPDPVPEAPARPSARQDFEFVNLRSEPRNATPKDTDETPTPPRPATAHRDRKEIIRLARQMIKAGAAGEQITRTLPISQSELALLQNGNTQ